MAVQLDVDAIYDAWTVELDLFGGTYTGRVRGSVLRLRPVFYPAAAAPDGWWVSPFVQAGPVRAERVDERRSGYVAAGGGASGTAGGSGR